MLLLFDIDGTLYHGNGSGWASFLATGRELFGESFTNNNINYAGRLDPWIFDSLAKSNGIKNTHEVHDKFMRATYECMRKEIDSGKYNICALPGAVDLLNALQQKSHLVTLGLLTGNYPRNGRLKLQSIGINPDWFEVCVWGIDAPTRNELPVVGRQRYIELTGKDISFDQIIIIGDTIHDINCAKAQGCKCLAVATGGGTKEELLTGGAELVVDNLTDTTRLVNWLVSGGVD